jgi:hypothetical protein
MLCRLQAQTLPNEAPSLGKIPPFTKITVTFDPMKRLTILLYQTKLSYYEAINQI